MTQPRVSNSWIKRSADFLFAVLVLFFFLPALLLVGLAIKLDSAGPVLCSQRRTGRNGKLFSIYRFRSMFVGEDEDRGVPVQSDDRRLTRFGRFLRHTSLNQVPQLLNILKGEMSFVGPRSYPQAHDQEFAAMLPDYTKRFRASPGLTGLAQVRGLRGPVMTKGELQKWLACDLEYIETWSPGLDLVILLKAFPCLFDDDGAC